jgi:DHA3 family tetracycline resistance protein-like MFS transporter
VVNAVWQAMIVAFIAEGSITVLVVVWVTLLQRLVAPDLLGRVSSLDWMVSIGGVPISFAIVGRWRARSARQTTMIWAGLLGRGCHDRIHVHPRRARARARRLARHP